MTLRLSSQNLGTAIRDHFLGGKVANSLFSFFEYSNEEIMGREQKE